jgi:hypothetical protein
MALRGAKGKAVDRSMSLIFVAWRPRDWTAQWHSIVAPSGSERRPCSLRTLKWIRISPSISSLMTKPKPRVASNHLTRPRTTMSSGSSPGLSLRTSFAIKDPAFY